MSTSESWYVNRHTARCTSPVSVVWQCKLVSGWGLMKRRSAPLYGWGRTLRLRLLLAGKHVEHLACGTAGWNESKKSQIQIQVTQNLTIISQQTAMHWSWKVSSKRTDSLCTTGSFVQRYTTLGLSLTANYGKMLVGTVAYFYEPHSLNAGDMLCFLAISKQSHSRISEFYGTLSISF